MVGGLATLVVAGLLGVAGFLLVDGARGTETGDTVELATDAPEAAHESASYSYAAASAGALDAASMSLDIVVEDPDGTVDIDVRVDRASGRVAFDFDISDDESQDAGQIFGDSFGMIIDQPDDTVYLTSNLLGSLFGADLDGWISIRSADFDTDATRFDQMFTNPLTITDLLGRLDPVDLGEEEIEGETLRHFQVIADAQLIAESTGATEKTFGHQIDDSAAVRYDVWVSADNEVRRISFETADPETDDRGAITIDVATSDKAVAIDLPSPDEIFDIDEMFGDIGFESEE